MKIKIIGLNNFDEKEVSAIRNSVMRGEPVINSDIFKKMVLAGSYTENRNMSRFEIYEMIMGGTIIHSLPQGEMQLDITGYKENSSSIGYTNMYGLKTYFNRVFLDKYNESEIFHNIVHEYCHTLGFYHREWWHKSKSVPYKVGYMVLDAYKQFYEKPFVREVSNSRIQFV